MSENKLIDQSMDFAVAVLELCDSIEGHFSLRNQLERSGASIGANIREANYAQSRADFISKLQIALKECFETEYWLELFMRAGLAEESAVQPLLQHAGSIRRMLIASVNTAKSKTD
jgi:four helix bundle protein